MTDIEFPVCFSGCVLRSAVTTISSRICSAWERTDFSVAHGSGAINTNRQPIIRHTNKVIANYFYVWINGPRLIVNGHQTVGLRA